MEQLLASDGATAQPQQEKVEQVSQVAWSVRSWSSSLDISTSYTRGLIARGQIKTRKCGNKRLIETPPAAYLASLPDGAV